MLEVRLIITHVEADEAEIRFKYEGQPVVYNRKTKNAKISRKLKGLQVEEAWDYVAHVLANEKVQASRDRYQRPTKIFS